MNARILLLTFISAFFVACLQRPKTFSPKNIPPHYKTIYIHNFDDRTFNPSIPSRLREKLRFAFAQNGHLRVIDQKETADLLLYGKIEFFQNPKGLTLQQVTSKQIIICKISIRNRKKPEQTLLANRLVRYRLNLTSPAQAEEKILEGVSRRIVALIFEN